MAKNKIKDEQFLNNVIIMMIIGVFCFSAGRLASLTGTILSVVINILYIILFTFVIGWIWYKLVMLYYI